LPLEQLMTGTFTSTITHLWSILDLGAPKFQPTGEIILSVGGVDITLKDTPDERHLLLTGVAGRLADDQRAAAQQVRALLRKGLGYLTSSRSCISLREEGGVNLTVVVQAIYPLDDHIDTLVEIIHEVLLVLEFARAELTAISPSRYQAPLQKTASETIIFMP
jgi:hypothetical protein